MTRFIAFYLPQYYPIPENDKWYGKGFTEWTNVAKAKPLYLGHYEPHVPADLGFYDMRIKSTIIGQSKLAREYGIEGFCYWHYWFGRGRRLLERPFEELVSDKSIDIGFCLSWANTTWYGDKWEHRSSGKKIIAEQTYPGMEDIDQHFYALLDAFRDDRYLRVDGKPIFCLHNPTEYQNVATFIDRWRDLAHKEGLSGFHFIARDFCCDDKKWALEQGFDAVYDMNTTRVHRVNRNIPQKALFKFARHALKKPTVYKYRDAINFMLTESDAADDVYPIIAPNWDNSPRLGGNSIIFRDCHPELFKQLVIDAMAHNNQPDEQNIIFIQSWNEWGEGNHLEPDLKYGHGYLRALAEARDEYRAINMPHKDGGSAC